MSGVCSRSDQFSRWMLPSSLSRCDGKWIRPCSTSVPALSAGQEYVILVKEIKSKKVSSGKFFSVRSFFLGFWNNFLGMVGFVKSRRAAKRNWNERMDYEDLIKQKTMEKKLARQQKELEAQNARNNKL